MKAAEQQFLNAGCVSLLFLDTEGLATQGLGSI